MTDQQIAGHDDWIAARGRFPRKKEGFSGGPARRPQPGAGASCPWECVKKEYLFEGANGARDFWRTSLGGRSQLIVYHFMYEPDWDIGMQERLLLGGRLQRNYSPSQRARHVAGRHLTGHHWRKLQASGQALRLDVQVGLLRWQRFHS